MWLTVKITLQWGFSPFCWPMPAVAETNMTHSPTVPWVRQSLISAGFRGQSSTYRLPPLTPNAPISWLLCLCLCLSSPRVLVRPWEEPGTHRHWLVVSNASTNSQFHGSQGGGRVRALRPAGASWVPAPTPRDLIVPLVAPPRAATWEGSHFIVTPWHQNVTSNSKVQRQRARQMSPQWTGCHREARGSRAAGVEMQGQGHCNSQTSISHSFSVPFPPLHCLFSGRPVEKCFEKN